MSEIEDYKCEPEQEKTIDILDRANERSIPSEVTVIYFDISNIIHFSLEKRLDIEQILIQKMPGITNYYFTKEAFEAMINADILSYHITALRILGENVLFFNLVNGPEFQHICIEILKNYYHNNKDRFIEEKLLLKQWLETISYLINFDSNCLEEQVA